MSKEYSLNRWKIINPNRQAHPAKACILVCYWAVQELGLNSTEAGQILSLSQSEVSRAVGRGEKLIIKMQQSLLG